MYSVVKLIIQFLRENNLKQSLHSLEKESNQTLNTMDNKARFIQDVLDGKWDLVLKQIAKLSLEKETLFDIYEQVCTPFDNDMFRVITLFIDDV
jgi:WD40 repeat-containing protein SMU1